MTNDEKDVKNYLLGNGLQWGQLFLQLSKHHILRV